ncbi:glycosyltransferase family 1 protein [Paenibacillus albiflavus]|uniref:Glycosyltransferase family 1 protein n=1 Tax=Paenibacillus albiflavus TaxID=2545760 RepID=A0A4R4EA33_9BACL|nr:glycosyltransferase family 4 protein [Paenibacillus albiflavus]TCZ75893.1 glycosyltransferase family 1 protein [Paenibacillus albiflavus]
MPTNLPKRGAQALHICMVAPEQIPVPPIVAGSVEICMYAIAKELAEQHEVTIISRSHPKQDPVTIRGKLTIIRVSNHKRGYIDSVLKVMQGKTFDLIQVDNRPQYAARIKAMFPWTPVSLFMHSLTFVTPPHSTLEQARACLDQVDLIIANSSSLQDELQRHFPECRVPIYKTFLGVNPQVFRMPLRDEKLLIRKKYKVSHTFNILFVGRIIPRKGIQVLIQAVRMLKSKIPHVRLIIAGGTTSKSYFNKMKKYAAAMHVPTVFTGYIPHRHLPQVYWLGDCFVCPSQRHEAFGLVNVEAMASGVPVVASANGGIKEIIHDGVNGLLVHHYHHPREFAQTIHKLITRPDYAESLSMYAHQDVMNRFTWTHTASQLEKIYFHYLMNGWGD